MYREDKNTHQLGRNILRLRLAKGLTRTMLARQAEISPRTLKFLETGRLPKRLVVGAIFRLSEILCCEPGELFTDSQTGGEK